MFAFVDWINKSSTRRVDLACFVPPFFMFPNWKKKQSFWGARGFAEFFKEQGGRVRQAGLEVTLRPHSLRSVWVSYLWTRTRRHEKFMTQIFQIFKDCPATARSLSKEILEEAPAFGKVAEFGCWRCILYSSTHVGDGARHPAWDQYKLWKSIMAADVDDVNWMQPGIGFNQHTWPECGGILLRSMMSLNISNISYPHSLDAATFLRQFL